MHYYPGPNPDGDSNLHSQHISAVITETIKMKPMAVWNQLDSYATDFMRSSTAQCEMCQHIFAYATEYCDCSEPGMETNVVHDKWHHFASSHHCVCVAHEKRNEG